MSRLKIRNLLIGRFIKGIASTQMRGSVLTFVRCFVVRGTDRIFDAETNRQE